MNFSAQTEEMVFLDRVHFKIIPGSFSDLIRTIRMEKIIWIQKHAGKIRKTKLLNKISNDAVLNLDLFNLLKFF